MKSLYGTPAVSILLSWFLRRVANSSVSLMLFLPTAKIRCQKLMSLPPNLPPLLLWIRRCGGRGLISYVKDMVIFPALKGIIAQSCCCIKILIQLILYTDHPYEIIHHLVRRKFNKLELSISFRYRYLLDPALLFKSNYSGNRI